MLEVIWYTVFNWTWLVEMGQEHWISGQAVALTSQGWCSAHKHLQSFCWFVDGQMSRKWLSSWTTVCRVLAQLQFDSWSVPIVVYGSLHWDDTSWLVIQPHSILGAGPWCAKIRLRGLIKGGWWMCYGWPDVERVGKWGHFGITRVQLHFACWNEKNGDFFGSSTERLLKIPKTNL